MTRITSLSLILLALLFASACTKKDSENTKVSARIDQTPIDLEIALSAEEQKKGLMNRETLAEGTGMLFVYSSPSVRSFWMLNTEIPLDIAFIDESGTFLQIEKLYPNDTDSVLSKSSEIFYVLEVPQGWFRKNRIRTGSQIDLAPIKEFTNERYGNDLTSPMP